ncbi:hypothetical protein JTB14_001954 [Gonioctena quinquepunctata]|nr:hypothetical protein JTB14_001954 [Gonioctena quinquepunctata]
MASTSSSFVAIDKLTGRDNYSKWKFAMKALLELDDLWKVVEGTETDEKKDQKALSKIILSVDKVNYSHLKSAATAKEACQNLEKAFEDSAHKLNEMKFKVEDEWVGTLLLAGLPDEYRPMIMGLESSGTKISGDSIKVKLLQDVKAQTDPKSASSNTAMYIKASYSKGFQKKGPKCYNCGKDIGTTKEISAVLPIENEDEEEQDQENDSLPDEQTNSSSDDSNQDMNEENNETIEIEEPRITRTGREVHKPKHFDDYEIYAAYDVLESEKLIKVKSGRKPYKAN